MAWNLANPSAPALVGSFAMPGTFLVSNGSNLLGVGNDNVIITYMITPNSLSANFFTPFTYHSTANLQVERANPIVFHPQAAFDEANGRLITMIDELNYQTLQPARTIAFDVFDYATAMLEGRDPRQYEQVSYTQGDEVKWNPLSVGSLVYVVGEMTGTQTYGACPLMTGRIEFDSIAGTVCGGSYIHGWVTGTLKITNVELFLDGGSLGTASLTGPPRIDIPSTTPVSNWQIAANLDATTKGVHVLRAVGTDINGNRRQFSSQAILFPGPAPTAWRAGKRRAHTSESMMAIARRARIARVGDRPSDDDVIRARRDRRGGRLRSALIAGIAALRTNARREDHESLPQASRIAAISCGEATTPRRPALLRELRQAHRVVER